MESAWPTGWTRRTSGAHDGPHNPGGELEQEEIFSFFPL
jgi:hypothetical protein